MPSARTRQRNPIRKRVEEATVDGALTQALEGVIDVTAQLMTGTAQAIYGIVEATSPTNIRAGGGDFGGGGSTGGWELPSVSIPNISLPDIDIDF